MTDWYGAAPVEVREYAPSHFWNWQRFCQGYGCQNDSAVHLDGRYLCVDCADEEFNDSLGE